MGYVIVIIAAFIAYFFFRRNSLIKQVNLFNRLLYIEKNPEKYIEEVDKLLRRIQPERERNINLIQKTTGLLYDGQFDEAIRILTDEIKKIPPNWQHLYYHNLILCLFLNGETERANNVLEDAKDVLELYAKRENNKSAIEFIYAVSDFYSGKGSTRKEFFHDLSQNGRNDYRVALGFYFLGKIYEQENNEEESEEKSEKAKIFGKGSFLERLY